MPRISKEVLLARMESARERTQKHLNLIRKQIRHREAVQGHHQAGALTNFAFNQRILVGSAGQSSSWLGGRKREIEALNRKLARQVAAILAFEERLRLGTSKIQTFTVSLIDNDESDLGNSDELSSIRVDTGSTDPVRLRSGRAWRFQYQPVSRSVSTEPLRKAPQAR